uniref:Replication factor A C-terminal domain-containing protein n=1 Tax=Bracon brevicornis TaxID=1563983 RepID=A0A6V7LU53_9HYME
MDPDTPGAHRLRGWWQTTGKEAQTSSISATSGGAMTGPSATLEKIREEGTAAGLPGAPTVHLCTATIALFRSENALYKACPTETCNKKVIDQGENFRCEKCNLDFPNYKYRLLGQVNIVDHTSQCWATAFSGEAEVIIGMTAQELGELMQQSEGDYAAAFAGVPFQEFTFKLKTQMENYNDSLRLRSTIQRVTQVNYRTYNKELLDMILEDK